MQNIFVRSTVFVLHQKYITWLARATMHTSNHVYTNRGPPQPKCMDSPTDLSEVPRNFCPDPDRHHGNLGSKFVRTPGPSSPPSIFGGPGPDHPVPRGVPEGDFRQPKEPHQVLYLKRAWGLLIALMISTYPCLLILLMNTVYRWWQPSVISDGMRPGVPSHLLPTVSGGWGF